MHRVLMTASAVWLLASSAMAADVAITSDDWSGFYLGGNVSWNFLSTDVAYDGQETQLNGFYEAFSYGSDNANGFGGGLQVGYDQQFGDFVLGLQAAASITGFETEFVEDNGSDGNERVSAEIASFGTLTARFGFVLQPELLAYVKGGLALANFELQSKGVDYTANTYAGSGSDLLTGWTVGGGLEYRVAPNWSAFVEYNFMEFGEEQMTVSYGDPGVWGDTFDFDHVDQHVSSVALGVNYRF
jgi:outer membrane immunogenic protein